MIVKQMFILLFIPGLSCSTLDLHLRERSLDKKPSRILIGNFERRNIDYEPFIVKNFRDDLRFEFFKLGYVSSLFELKKNNSSVNSDKSSILKKELTVSLNNKRRWDIFVQGAISEREIGDLTDNEKSSSVLFLIYGRKGDKIGEAQYITSKTLSDHRALKKISEKFVRKLHKEISKAIK